MRFAPEMVKSAMSLSGRGNMVGILAKPAVIAGATWSAAKRDIAKNPYTDSRDFMGTNSFIGLSVIGAKKSKWL